MDSGRGHVVVNNDLQTHVDRFRDLVERATPLLRPRVDAATRDFLARGRRLIIGPARKQLANLESQLAPLMHLMQEPGMDLFRVAGLSWAEDAYTELIAWTMDPRVHGEVATVVQRVWLESLLVEEASQVSMAAIPKTQLWLEGEIPDLVLLYGDFVVVVEAKTSTEEHTTRSGKFQTESYPDVVRRNLACAEIPIHIVFLTIDRTLAVNTAAISTTYLNFALVLAQVAQSCDLPNDVAVAFRMIATHFAGCAIPNGIDVSELMADIRHGMADDAALVRHLSTIQKTSALLQG